MSSPRLASFSLLLLLALAASASAQDAADSRGTAGAFPEGFDQAVYKGLVGNVLDAVPMDPSKRLGLQRTNAVVSNTLFGRTLTVLAGLSNPVLLVGGFVWGMWAASNIKPATAYTKLNADPVQAGDDAATRERMAALRVRSSEIDDAPARSVHEPILISSIYSADSGMASVSQAHVVKIWLPQRPSALPQ